ncbi:DUF1697 domain-containing protein [Flagellimonas algicola]|uniref:DUF1697 domain-containing protein n=1 Tax=Flagellimonas algicola TaxID=2583815 RepID=A0ABY2WKX2_9FLAO|nr:DUF1697 domain-containing protein [Allomuricauda algicola]TMU55484.1 DUF1697 domain-containing protein [Allomuricauda algicola]
MKTFIVLLRGINVGGQKKIKMADLRQCLTQSGFQDVETYIQSGNLSCKKDGLTAKAVEIEVHKVILKHFGFDVPTLVLTKEELKRIIDQNPYAGEEEKSLYFVLLKSEPEKDLMDSFNLLHFDNEAFQVNHNCVYLCCKAGYGKAKLSNNLIENKLKVQATTRNFRTMMKLLEMAQS